MNKETRIFIWGLIMFFLACTALSIRIGHITQEGLNWMSLWCIVYIYLVIKGLNYVFKSIN